jgi:glycosyltransferase involved in cell wall biosynthesis
LSTKIAYVTSADMAIRFLLLGQLLHLQEIGYEVTAICSSGPWIPEIEAAGIPVETAPLARSISPLTDLIGLYRLIALFRKQKYDLVHTHTPKANMLGRLAARLAGVPFVVATEHGFFFYGKRGLSFYLHKWLASLGARLSNRVLVINQEDLDIAQTWGICHTDQVVYIKGGVGVDTNYFSPRQADATKIRKSLGLLTNGSVVGIVGRLTLEKGYGDFFKAATLIKNTLPDTQFLIVGQADVVEQDLIESLADQAGVRQNTFFMGWRTDMPTMYTAMDVLVLPSYREGLPVNLMEAAAMGLPAVATDIRGCREVIIDNETGLLVPPGDWPVLARAIIQLLNSPEERRRMGQFARRRAENLFEAAKVYQQVEAVYDELLNR